MTRQRNAIDGFVPRRGGGDLSSRSLSAAPKHDTPKPANHGLQPLGTSIAGSAETPLRRNPTAGLTKTDIDESLRGIDAPEDVKKGKRRGRKGPISKKKRIIKWSIIGLLVILLAVGGWLAYKALTASSNIFKGNIFGLVQMQPLKEDENGRSNILILGTSEDDPGHGGAYLTDSMMVMSIHQKNKTVDMFSIPRDLYVDYGMACNSGYQGKINEYFNCVNDDWTDPKAEEQRLTDTRKFVGDIFGLDVQYAVHVNNTVIKEAVDAVGGVDVDVQGSNGEPGVLDRNFDWRCNYQCYFVKYDNGVHHLDGEHALFLAMARGSTPPTYGLGNSNFDREKNQQKIIIALKEKAVSTGTLTDVGKVTGLIDALGNNLRTNFDTSEIRTLMDVAAKVKSEEIKSISLFDGENSVVTTGNYGGASVALPTAGVFNYDQIRKFLDQKLTSNPVTREAANVVVLNGSGQAGVAGTEAENLESKGFIISEVGNAPEGTYGDVDVYQIGDGKTATKEKLESLFSVKVKTSTPPVPVNGNANFVVIFGKPHTTTN